MEYGLLAVNGWYATIHLRLKKYTFWRRLPGIKACRAMNPFSLPAPSASPAGWLK